ncbi:ATP-binding Cassette (ABC) superfamily [Phytophthora infestans T30-4]|uniref:ATP-binding Cassette (ABC) superfamily n=1 Tax=Phytophthora infestans (strain T30-4) TaxID=403677 RepID=D0P3I2_PHYIT|nr:ATP-binding Cassette (ABC) superfamily [Phytophthora infestans T30-4]EEY60024.1 ATP-binding Cassette (ABC) superfamily [Phytophthora infestans T30-4]|eukprot:XP_002895145.1 ATP-binding Cassette (ABC) superfamily [Phytophthora infestans T30-4]
MSFFTLDTFQQYHQEVGAAMAPKLDSKPDRAANLSAKATSELDPLSALNLARAADPWLGNLLLTSAACSYLDSSEGSSASAVAATSLKVVAVDHPDEDWGEF